MVDTLKRAFQKFLADDMGDHAAALTYFAMLSLFPALLVTATLLGILGDQSLVTKAVDYARSNGAPKEVVDALRSSLQSVVDAAGGALSAALFFSLAIALYGAAGVFGGSGRALNKVHGVKETRPFFRHKAWDLGWTLVAILLAIVALFSVFLGGGIAGDLFGTIGLGDTAAAIWRVARWFVAIAAVLGMYAIAYAFAPNVNPRRVRILTPGAVTGVLIWILASIGFFVYVSNFGKYGATYGAFAGAVVLLLWLYISNIAFLFGAELNAIVDMQRGIGRGGPPAPSPPPSPEFPAPPEGGPEGAGGGGAKHGRDALAQR